jgi:iron complex transport system ATP-binding protein
MSRVEISGLTVARNGRRAIDGATLSLSPGEFVGLIGPNGAGKTTLLRAALGLQRSEGRSSLAAMPLLERARTAAFLPQTREVAWPVSVEMLVGLGRNPHLAGARASAADREAVAAALARLDIASLAARPVTTLSGGELARALIARLLAQDTPFLLADEPIAGLDPAAQITVMRLFAELAAEGRGLLVALHDLGLAARHCTRLVALNDGRVVADGPPTEVLSPDLLAKVFGITAYRAQTHQGDVLVPLDLVTNGMRTG